MHPTGVYPIVSIKRGVTLLRTYMHISYVHYHASTMLNSSITHILGARSLNSQLGWNVRWRFHTNSVFPVPYTSLTCAFHKSQKITRNEIRERVIFVHDSMTAIWQSEKIGSLSESIWKRLVQPISTQPFMLTLNFQTGKKECDPFRIASLKIFYF